MIWWPIINAILDFSNKLIVPLILAINLVELSKNKANPSDFAVCLDEDFAIFQFPDDFIFDVWGAIQDAKDGRI